MIKKLPPKLLYGLAIAGFALLSLSVWLELAHLDLLSKHPVLVNLLSGAVGFCFGVLAVALIVNRVISSGARDETWLTLNEFVYPLVVAAVRAGTLVLDESKYIMEHRSKTTVEDMLGIKRTLDRIANRDMTRAELCRDSLSADQATAIRNIINTVRLHSVQRKGLLRAIDNAGVREQVMPHLNAVYSAELELSLMLEESSVNGAADLSRSFFELLESICALNNEVWKAWETHAPLGHFERPLSVLDHR